MFYDFAILVPAATAESDLIKYTLKLTYGIITHVYVEFPAGCRGYVYLTLDWEGHQLYPTNPDGAFNTEDYIIPIEDRFPLLFQPYSLYAKVWAPQTTYDHTLTVRIEILEPDLLYPEARLPASLEKVITFLGGVPTPPPEEVPPPAPAPPAPAPPPAPPAPPPTPPAPAPPAALFVYTSGIYVAGKGYWAPAGVDGYFIEVQVQNVGAGAGTCNNNTLYVDFEPLGWGIPMDWVWVVRNLDLTPGQVGALRWWAPYHKRRQRFKVVGDAGAIESPYWSLT